MRLPVHSPVRSPARSRVRLRVRAALPSAPFPAALLLTLLLTLLVAGCANPRTEANLAQAMNDAANQIGGLEADVGQLQDDLDSLRQVVAHQDTLIARIAAVNGVPIR